MYSSLAGGCRYSLPRFRFETRGCLYKYSPLVCHGVFLFMLAMCRQTRLHVSSPNKKARRLSLAFGAAPQHAFERNLPCYNLCVRTTVRCHLAE